tara:strand:+ start:1854 stop:2261 length:408 start_codon:yes stop_codon:yes gene_type:complete
MKSISKLKKELDKFFSLYIRLREATDEGMVQCFTCGKVSHYKSGMQCGHFQSRRHHITRWDKKNCQVQCVKCNMYEQGEQFRFGIGLDAKYGAGTAEELEFLAKLPIKLTRVDYEEKITYYKNAVNNFKKEKGLD